MRAAPARAASPTARTMNITDTIRAHATTTPDAPAIQRAARRALSYAALDRILDAIGRRALEAGLAPGDVAGVSLQRNRDFGEAFGTLLVTLGLARVGIVAKDMSGSGTPVAACFQTEETPVTAGVRPVIVDRLWFHDADAGAPPPLPIHADGAGICRIFPSWDANGTLREIPVSHEQMIRRMRSRDGNTPLPARPITAIQVGFAGAYLFRDALRTLAAGGTVAVVRTPTHVITTLERLRANGAIVVPGMLEAILDELPADSLPFASIERFEIGGGEVPARLYERASARLTPNLHVSWSPGETDVVAQGPLSALVGRPGAVGYVVPGVEVQAVDEDDHPVPPGTDGILRIRSALCVDHYLGDPAVSAQVFRDGWVYLGDMGSVSNDGMLVVAGRAIGHLRPGGSKGKALRIEEALRGVSGITDAAAFGVAGATGATTVWAAVVADDRFSYGAVKAACRELQTIAPERILRMPSLPRTADGRVARAELVQLALGEPAHESTYV